LIKLRCLELPASMKEKFSGRSVYLVAATLRPETMYGQTNCYVLPEGNYGVFEMKNDELYICS
jgi:leucyl-tRNA synthetase